MKDLVLFTADYPLRDCSEVSFVLPELRLLKRWFERIIIVPARGGGDAVGPFDGDTLLLDRSYTRVRFSGRSVWREFRRPWRILGKVLLHPRLFIEGPIRMAMRKSERPLARECLRQAVSFCDFVQWFRAFCARYSLKPETTVFYSFWLDREALFLGLYSRYVRSLAAISRAHRYDIYLPEDTRLRILAMKTLSRIYPCSDCGTEYLRGRFPGAANHIETAYLGVEKLSDGVNPDAQDTEIHFVSCHRLVPLKRLGLCLACLRALSSRMPQAQVTWNIIGDGPEYDAMKAAIQDIPENLRVVLHGGLPNGAVQALYAERHFDFMIMLSKVEGLPVADIEAMAYGIPVIATDVGGTREAFDGGGGILLPADVTPELFCERVLPLLRNKQALGAMRQKAYETYRRKFVSDTCRSAFVAALAKL